MNLNPLPEKVIEATENIYLSDLLKSTTFRHFVLSALGNGISIRHDDMDLKDQDDMFLRFKIDQLVKTIPEDDRRDYFQESTRLIREHKERKLHRHSQSLQAVSAFKGLPVLYK